MPTSTITLVANCPLDHKYGHTLTFANQAEQLAYFNGKRYGVDIANVTYKRKGGPVKINANYDMLAASGVNYLITKNPPMNKPYFYFITSKQYISPTTTLINMELDVLQTFLFDYSVAACYVEREHSADEGRYTKQIDEALELGEYVTCGALDMAGLNNYAIIMLATLNPAQTTEQNTVKTGGNYLNGIYNGVGMFAIEQAHFDELNNTLATLDSWGKSDGIMAMWMYPKGLIGLQSGYSWGDSNVFKPLGGLQSYTTELPLFGPDGMESLFQGYTPRNSKLYDYPYHMLYITNNQGQAMIIQPEYNTYESGALYGFTIRGSYGTDSSIKLIPRNYKGEAENFEEGLTIDNFPPCAWTQDAYKIWMAQNAHQINAQMEGLETRLWYNNASVMGIANDVSQAMGIPQMLKKLFAGYGMNGEQGLQDLNRGLLAGTDIIPFGVGGNMKSHFEENAKIKNEISLLNAKISDAKVQPPQSKGQYGNATLNVSAGKKVFSAKWKTIDYGHAKMIDDYFTMYGYKCLNVKVPNTNSRTNWNYVKTVGCHIVTGIDAEDARAIESIYDAGITFWHNPTTFLDYSQSNNPI